MNLGLISTANYLTSLTHSARSCSLYPVNFSISLFHTFIFFNYLAANIIEAAANYDGLNLKRVASRRDTSCKYYAKKNTSSSFRAWWSLRYLYKNLYALGAVTLKSRVSNISFSIYKTIAFVNLFSLTCKKSFRAGG